MKRITFRNMQAPGDLLMLGVAIRDLHLTYPNEFQIKVESCYPEVFYNSPWIFQGESNEEFTRIDVGYSECLKNKKETGCHFSEGFIEDINRKLNLSVRKTSMFPEVFLTEEEKSESILEKLKLTKPFWLFNAGFKNDMPLKAYPPSYWQMILNTLGICLVQTGNSDHNHPVFKNIISVVGKTNNLRDYFSLVYHSEGLIGGVSLQMHLAAALNKPCVVIAGGREEPQWEKYPNHHYLHSIGKFDCCKEIGCWKKARKDCLNMGKQYPKCMESIFPEMVIQAVLQCEEEKHGKVN